MYSSDNYMPEYVPIYILYREMVHFNRESFPARADYAIRTRESHGTWVAMTMTKMIWSKYTMFHQNK